MSKQTILDYESAAGSDKRGSDKRGPYKRSPKSTETASVVGVYEDAPAAIPPMPKPEDFGWRPDRPGANSGRGSFETRSQEQAYYDAFDRHVAAVNGQTPPPVIVPRNNIPNRYDREALAAVGEWVRLPPPITAESLLHFFDVLKIVGATDRGAFFGTFVEVGRVSKKNDYGVSALEDFIEDPDRLNRAQAHFLRLTQNGMTEKTAFRLMLMTYCDE